LVTILTPENSHHCLAHRSLLLDNAWIRYCSNATVCVKTPCQCSSTLFFPLTFIYCIHFWQFTLHFKPVN
jgi:hypothetical protein